MSAHAQPHLTPEEYLEIERAAEYKNEYYNGHMYGMSGASPRHVFITSNLNGELRTALKGSGCRVGANDLRVRVSPGGLYAYPDIVAFCGEAKYADKRNDTLINPLLMIEVLSPSTEAYDRGFKATQYRTLESLQEYALVSQTEPRVEVFRRHPEGWLLSEFAGLEAVCRFDSVNCAIPLAEIYLNVDFTEQAPPSEPAQAN